MSLRDVAREGQKIVELLEKAQAVIGIGGAPAHEILAVVDAALATALDGTPANVTRAIDTLDAKLRGDLAANDAKSVGDLDAAQAALEQRFGVPPATK